MMSKRKHKTNPDWHWVTYNEDPYEYLYNQHKELIGYREVGTKVVKEFGGAVSDFPVTRDHTAFDDALDHVLNSARTKGIDVNDPKVRIQVTMIRKDD